MIGLNFILKILLIIHSQTFRVLKLLFSSLNVNKVKKKKVFYDLLIGRFK